MLRFAGLAIATVVCTAVAGNMAMAQQIKAKPGMSMISNGSCCARVNGVCISACQKPGGCTGKGDCNVIKGRGK